MTRLISRLILLAALLAGAGAQAQISFIYTGGVYSQNFDGLNVISSNGDPGTTAIPNNQINTAWKNGVTLPGWYASKATFNVTDGTLGGNPATFENASGLEQNVGLFSFGTAGSADRALGSRATGVFADNNPVLFGVCLENKSGTTLTKFTVVYTGEQWLKATTTNVHTLLFDYQLGATAINSGSWTAVSAGTFSAPVSTGGGATVLDGNLAANRSTKVFTVSGISWAPDQKLWVRFRDDNESDSEQGLGVDDFNFWAGSDTGLYFNGASSYVSMGTGAANATKYGASSFTIECRFMKTGTGTTASTGTGGLIAVPLIAKGVGEGDDSNLDANYFLGIDTSGRLCADFEQFNATNNGTAYAAGQNFPATGSTVLQTGVWYHAAATYNATTAIWKLYINGAEEAITTPIAPFVGVIPRSDNIQGLGLGTTINSSGNTAGFFQGVMEEARIWNKVRTLSEIQSFKDVRTLGTASGLLARFRLNEGTGTTVSGTKESDPDAVTGTLSGTLSGSVLPAWVTGKAYLAMANLPPVVTLGGPANNATGVGSSVQLSATLSDAENDAQTVTFYGRETSPSTPGADFSLIAIPDTQHYSENTNYMGGASAAIYSAQTQWIVDNRTIRNVAFVSHMGDIVQNANLDSEWLNADSAMRKIESPAETLRGFGIPWGGAPGNHDQLPAGDASGSTALFNQYFGPSRFAGRSYYRGYFGDSLSTPSNRNNNNYEFFSASGLDFIILHLEYDLRAQSNYQAVLDWANALLQAYPNRRAIVTSHYTVNTGNPGTFSAQGQIVYDALKGNPNLFLMLGGHVSGEGRRSDVYQGRTVYSILQDYQEITNGGNGFLRIFTFSPANNRISVESYSPTLGRAVQASDNVSGWSTAYTLPYTLQGSPTGWIPLGTANVAAGGTSADLSWNGLDPSKNYEWYAASDDGVTLANSGSNRFATALATSPTVSLTSPTPGQAFTSSTVPFTATAADSDGSIARVEYYQGSTKLGQATVAPYTFSWTTAATGSYALTAVAVDNSGLSTASSVVNITVTAPNQAPTVSLTAPTGTQYGAGSTVTLAANAADADGTIAKVQFYNGATLLNEDTLAPFTYDWVTPATTGTYVLKAVAIDNASVSTQSATKSIDLVAAPFSYTQDFNSMGTGGTSLPSGWSMKNAAGGTNGATWAASVVASDVANMVDPSGSLVVNNSPTATENKGYNAANPSDASNRMPATSPTGIAGVAIQLALVNTTSTPISSIDLKYDVQRFTTNTQQYELPGYWVFYSLNGTSWTNVASLNSTVASEPFASTGTRFVPKTNIQLSGSWAVGSTLYIRWVDDNAQNIGPDQIYGLDNVTVSTGIGVSPLVSLSSPTNNQTYIAPASVVINATATDSDGTISKVEFYQGSTKLGESTASPYSYTWANVAAGSYTVTAAATDNNLNTSSASSNIVVSPTPGNSGTLTRGPYLQMAGSNRMNIRWRSSASTAGRVKYGTSAGALNTTVDETVVRTDHDVAITGLQPSTTYYYSIGSALDTLASGAGYTFTTSPVPGDVANTRIWVLGDAGTANSNASAVRDAFNTWTGARAPNLVLELGDNAYNSGTDSEFQAAVFNMHTTELRRTPFWSCLGNHETGQDTTFKDTYPYFDIYTFPKEAECGGYRSGTEHYFSWDYGNIHFISLDSMTADRSPTGAMAVWLTTDLQQTTATWIIALYHHPSYTRGSHNSDSETPLVEMRSNIQPILEAGGVDMVLAGHSHSYERSYLLDKHYGTSGTLTSAMKLDAGDGRPAGNGAYTKPLGGTRDHKGAVYAVPGSAGQISGGSLNHPAHFISLNELGSMVLDINGNRLDATFIRENGSIRDTFTILKSGVADTDHDGMSDEYEIANGLDRLNPADAALDSDGDGLSNLQEFNAGTKANDASDKPRVASATPQPDGSMTLQIATVSGKLYRVDANNAFPSGNWSVVANNVVGTGALVPVADPGAVGIPTRIYRVVLLP